MYNFLSFAPDVLSLQARLLGSLSVLLVDRECRRPLLNLDPGSQCLFELCYNLPGYADKAWAATRRETAAKAITSLIQRDHDARSQLILTGGIGRVLELLDSKVGGISSTKECGSRGYVEHVMLGLSVRSVSGAMGWHAGNKGAS